MATKKSRTALLPPINRAFQIQVKTLAAQAGEIAKSYADLTGRMLKFAENIKRLSDQARKLDSDKDDGEHQKLLKDAITEAIGTNDKSVLSKFVTIGSQAKAMLTYKDNLPSQRDGLYEVALALKKNKPVQKWIETEKLTNESSVRDVRTLYKKPKKQRGNKITTSNKAEVTLYFSSYSDAATALKDLMLSSAQFTVRSEDALSHALIEQVGKSLYDTTIAPRFA